MKIGDELMLTNGEYGGDHTLKYNSLRGNKNIGLYIISETTYDVVVVISHEK